MLVFLPEIAICPLPKIQLMSDGLTMATSTRLLVMAEWVQVVVSLEAVPQVPISAIAGLECAQSGSRRVRHPPTSLMSPTPSIWA